MPQPKITLTVQLEPGQYRAIKEIAQKADRPMSSVVRKWLLEHIQRNEKQQHRKAA